MARMDFSKLNVGDKVRISGPGVNSGGLCPATYVGCRAVTFMTHKDGSIRSRPDGCAFTLADAEEQGDGWALDVRDAHCFVYRPVGSTHDYHTTHLELTDIETFDQRPDEPTPVKPPDPPKPDKNQAVAAVLDGVIVGLACLRAGLLGAPTDEGKRPVATLVEASRLLLEAAGYYMGEEKEVPKP